MWSAWPAPPQTPSSSGGHPVLVSQSGQFVVSRPWTRPLPPDLAAFATNPTHLRLEPALLVVSCERTRQRLSHELGGLPPYRDRIHLTLVPARGPAETLTLLADRFPGGWKYRLAVPEVVGRRRLLETLVHVILLEVANQSAGDISTDLPAWLIAGLAGRLQTLAEEELLFPPPSDPGAPVAIRRTLVERKRYDPLVRVRPILQEQGPLSWQELCWPGVQGADGPETDRYRASAELLLHELLRLPKGPQHLAGFVAHRARFLNWQAAFLDVFQDHFPRLLDVEKWWALQLALYERGDPQSPAPLPNSWAALQETVRVPAEVRTSSAELPQFTTNLTLQTVIREWDWSAQRQALTACLVRLESLRASVPWEAQVVAAAYVQTLRAYLEQRPRAEVSTPAAGLTRPSLIRLLRDTLQQLDALDAEVAARLQPPSSAAGRAGSSAGPAAAAKARPAP
ncbi:MAG: hypothetical protein WHT82_01980 [Limisphaera sp.]